MQKFVYINDTFLPAADAKISIFDRGLLFADAIYEVNAILDKKLLDFNNHMERLQSSIQKLAINYKVDKEKLFNVHKRLIELNELQEGSIYCQISRGQGDRNFIYSDDMPANIFMFTKTQKIDKAMDEIEPSKVISVPDGRWCRRDIKTVQLLYSSMQKTLAQKHGAQDTIFYDEDGYITECSSSNFHILTADKKLITPPLSDKLLPGITRARIIKMAPDLGYSVEERPITINEAKSIAVSAFTSSATSLLQPIQQIDDTIITKDHSEVFAFRSHYLKVTPYS